MWRARSPGAHLDNGLGHYCTEMLKERCMSQLELRFLRYQRVDDEQWSGAGRVPLMDLMFAHNGALIWNLSSPLLLGIRVPKMIESRVNQTRSGFD